MYLEKPTKEIQKKYFLPYLNIITSNRERIILSVSKYGKFGNPDCKQIPRSQDRMIILDHQSNVYLTS